MRRDVLASEKKLREILAPRLNRKGVFKSSDAWELARYSFGYGTALKFCRAFMEQMVAAGAAEKLTDKGRWEIKKENAFSLEVGRGIFGPKTTWININARRPDPGDRVLVVLDYTKYGRKKRVEIANVHYTLTPRPYGGPNALGGAGHLTGLYFAIPAVIPLEYVSHWQPIPELF